MHPCPDTRLQGHCWELTTTGWCCFWSLVCTLPICCCLPCLAPCSMCHPRFQRPVYGYPIQCQVVTGAPQAKGGGGGEPTEGSASATAAAVSSEPQEGTPGAAPQLVAPPVVAVPLGAFGSNSPSPRPQSIFVPPSAVPVTGFSIPSPGYPKYKPELRAEGSAGGSLPNSGAGTPRGTFGGSFGGGGGGGAASRMATPSPLPSAVSPRAPEARTERQQGQQQQDRAAAAAAVAAAPESFAIEQPPMAPPELQQRQLLPPWRGAQRPHPWLEPQAEEGGGGHGAGDGTMGCLNGRMAQQHTAAGGRGAGAPQRSAIAQDGSWGSRQNSRQISLDGVSTMP